MSEEKQLDVSEMIKVIEESMNITIVAIDQLRRSPMHKYAKSLAYAMLHIDTNMNILKGINDDLRNALIKHLTSEAASE